MGVIKDDSGYGFKKKTTPKIVDESAAWTDPTIAAATAATQAAGYNPAGDYGSSVFGGIYDQMKGAGQQPTNPGGGGGGGGGGRGGSTSAAAISALKTLFGMYQKPQDPALGQQLAAQVGQAQTTGANAIAQLQATLGAQQNPFAHQVAGPVVAQNPLQQYMQQGGADTGGVDALQQLLRASTQQSQQANQQYMDQTSASWQSGQQGRVQDAATSQAAFQQALATQNQSYQTQLAQGDAAKKEALMMQILQMAISSGADLNKLGIKF